MWRWQGVLLACLWVEVAVCGGPFGLAKTPPMGWRSWNCFHGNVDQASMMSIMDKMVEKNRTVNGKPTSLLELGYENCGLDDNWQACGKGVQGSFHNAEGYPLVNTDRFPDMKAMTTHGHNQGLKVGWYMNNCICKEGQFTDPAMIQKIYEGSVKAIIDYGYDGMKLDGCSQFHNTSLWAELMDKAGRPILVENCHNSRPTFPTDPTAVEPYNFFRTSGDIGNSWSRIFGNLQTTTKYQGNPPLARPGVWAYPDMLEVGRMPTYQEDRSHFGAWCVVSSPLVLGYNLTDEATTDKVWDIITNTEAIAVNQKWAGHPGMLVKSWDPSADDHAAAGDSMQIWAKPQPNKAMAVFVVSNEAAGVSRTVDIDFSMLNITGTVDVRDIWEHKDLGAHTTKLTTDSIGSHDSRFYLLTPKA